ncbi:alpha/beta hydrolase domain-containing protein [Glaciecola petra]|uniref:Alpha/beta hydrolase domain-containing protein n=1 Tax=Glaciecola petra TaxID=3075602 RepID=A0ABU2ZNL3_9ALTE|nr:alpha/beta hydrolase domain-containing protein [Aestuariibacter sp. P117]MDT0594006.1 alpha/beta hydrolase domain-containing protein [Aestuariibacter sp. P117]
MPLLRLCSLLLIILCSFSSHAKLVNVQINEQTNFIAFGIELEAISGNLHFEFDPKLPQNQHVTDIQLANMQDGKVAVTSTFFIIQPADKNKRKATLLEISNRGSKASLRYFNKAVVNNSPTTASSLGDGLLQRLGLSVMWVGWQADVYAQDNNMSVILPRAKNTTGMARSDWTIESQANKLRLAHRDNIKVLYVVDKHKQEQAYLTRRLAPNDMKQIVPSSKWRFSEQGDAIVGDFNPGIYELVYPTQESIVVGLGFALIRDTAEYIKKGDSRFSSPKTIAFGVSQTGRWLRHFLYQGFNKTEAGNIAFDGMLIHTAGAGRGSFNHRFAQASRDAHRMSAFFYPTDVFPFASRPVEHPVTGEPDGLMLHMTNAFHPKVFYTNTGYEYWGRAAALIHSHNGKDIEPLATERIYHLASAQHFVERQSNLKAIDGKPRYFQGNSLDLLLNLRALISALTEWVVDDKSPPKSRFPRFSDNTLVNFENYNLPNMLSDLRKPISPHTAYIYDYGKQWQQGVIKLNPPRILATIVPPLPAVDSNGNEIAGIRHPLLEAPIASFLPWVLRHNAQFAQDEMMDFRGAIKLLPKQQVLQRYANWDAYRRTLETAISHAITQGFILEEDRDSVLTQGEWLWKLATD